MSVHTSLLRIPIQLANAHLVLCAFLLLFSTLSNAQVDVKYSYDALGRLIEVKGDANDIRTYQYDKAGNRVSLSANASNPGNTAPIARNDSLVLIQHLQESRLNVVANDTDANGDTLSIVSFTTSPSLYIYKVNQHELEVMSFNSSQSNTTFSYTISDGNGGTDTAVVFVTLPSAGGNPFFMQSEGESDDEDGVEQSIDVGAGEANSNDTEKPDSDGDK